MPLCFVLDEHLRGGALWHAIAQHNAAGVNVIDAVRVGDPPVLPRGSTDPTVLLWAETERRLLVSLDKSTLPGHLAQHLRSGHHSPGILIIRAGSRTVDVVEFLVLVAHVSAAQAWEDAISFIP